MEKNKVKYGLKNVHYAPITVVEDGEIAFGTPVAIPGAVNLSLDQAGEQSKFYADDMAYYVSYGNDGYTGSLEIAMVPDSFRIDILGDTLDEDSKVLIERADAEPKSFALLFEFAGDKHAVRHVMYNCSSSRPSVASGTKTNTKEPKTESLSITASPMPDGKVKAKTTETTNETAYSNWYKTVWQPTA